MKKLNISKLKTVIVVQFLIIALLGSLVYVYAQSTEPFIISEGFYPSIYDYTISLEGSTILAKNPYGRIVYQGSDAYTVIQNAFSNGKSAFITNGIYQLNNELSITTPHFILNGEGEEAVLKQTTSGKCVINIGTSSDFTWGVTIRDLSVMGDNSSTSHGINAELAHNLVIERVNVTYNDIGIRLTRTIYPKVMNNLIQHNRNHGVCMTSYSTYSSVNAGEFFGNRVYDNGGDGYYMLDAKTDSIIGGSSEQNDGAGLRYVDCRRMEAIGIHIEGNNVGIVMEDGADTIGLEDSEFQGILMSGNGAYGVNAEHGNRVKFYTCRTMAHTASGWLIGSSSDDVWLIGCFDNDGFINNADSGGRVRFSSNMFMVYSYGGIRLYFDFVDNDYLSYDLSNDRYLFYINGTVRGYVDTTGFNNGAPP